MDCGRVSELRFGMVDVGGFCFARKRKVRHFSFGMPTDSLDAPDGDASTRSVIAD
jgi:hypothetical protein